MEVEERTSKIKELRDELRNGRISSTSENSDGHNSDDDSSFRTAFEDTAGERTGISGDGYQPENNHSQPRSHRRSVEAKPGRFRPSNRRSSQSDSSSAGDSTSTKSESEHAIGRIVADGPIATRNFAAETTSTQTSGQAEEPVKRRGGWPKGKPRKGTTSEEKPEAGHSEEKRKVTAPFLRKGNVLSTTEARDLAEPLISSLENDFQAIDTYLWGRLKNTGTDTHDQPIWSDLDQEEIEKLTSLMLKWGQHNDTAATIVRSVIDLSDYVAVGTIFVPRIKRTVDIMRETRKPRAKRGQNNEGAHK